MSPEDRILKILPSLRDMVRRETGDERTALEESISLLESYLDYWRAGQVSVY